MSDVAAPEFLELSEDEFHEKYRPQLAPSGDLLEYDAIRSLPVNTVWTVVEGEEPEGDDEDDGEDRPSRANWYALPGIHLVNRMGYLTTEVPWETENMQAVYFDASDLD